MSMPDIVAGPPTGAVRPATIGPSDLPHPGDPMRTRPASIVTIAIALGLALTSIGLARSLPYTVGGAGSPTTVGADLWAHGTAISPALVALVVAGLLGVIAMRPTRGGRRASGWLGVLAAIAMRPTRGGRRAASWLATVAGAVLVTGLLEPAQRDAVLFALDDLPVSAFVIAYHATLIALVLSATGEVRRPVGDSIASEPDAAGRQFQLGASIAA
jgi:hypothetical protein